MQHVTLTRNHTLQHVVLLMESCTNLGPLVLLPVLGLVGHTRGALRVHPHPDARHGLLMP